MKILFYIGWGLLLAAFAAASAEVLARTITGDTYLLIPALELWYTLAPGSLTVAQIRLENWAPWIWDPLVIHLLLLPAWAILGVPGGIMIGVFKPHKPTDWRDREEVRKQEEALMLYDELTQDARAQGMTDDSEGKLPDHSALEALESLEPLDDDEPHMPSPKDTSRAEFDALVRDAGITPRQRPASSED